MGLLQLILALTAAGGAGWLTGQSLRPLLNSIIGPQKDTEVGLSNKDPMISNIVQQILSEGATQRARTTRLALLNSRPEAHSMYGRYTQTPDDRLGSYYMDLNRIIIDPRWKTGPAGGVWSNSLLKEILSHELAHSLISPSGEEYNKQPLSTYWPSMLKERLADYMAGPSSGTIGYGPRTQEAEDQIYKPAFKDVTQYWLNRGQQ